MSNKTKEKVMVDINEGINRKTLLEIFTKKADFYDLAKELNPSDDDLPFKNTKTKEKAIEFVIEHWDYDIALDWARYCFFNNKLDTEGSLLYGKYKTIEESKKDYNIVRQYWEDNFSESEKLDLIQGTYEHYIQDLNRKDLPPEEKDRIISEKMKLARAETDLNIKRNDLLELLMITNFDNVFPTVSTKSSVDYYINGIAFDQKVSKSVGAKFNKKYCDGKDRDEQIKFAKNNKDLVAQSLFDNQGQERLNKNIVNRLFIINASENISFELLDVIKAAKSIDINSPSIIKSEKIKDDNGNYIEFKSLTIIF